MNGRFVGLVAAISLCLGAPAGAAAQTGAEFFRGKTITYVVATDAGGGYDSYGRLLARYLGKHMPGTRVLVRNVPGAGHMIGANTIYVARPDGLTIGTFNTGLIYAQLLHQPGVKFDLGRMSWVGKMADEGRSLLIAKNSGIRSLQDLITATEPVRIAASGIGSASYLEMRILADVLKLNVRLVSGFGGGETQLSMMRGEVAGVLNTASTHDDFIRRGQGRLVVAIAGARSEIAGVPQARDFVQDRDGRRLLALVEVLAELGRLTAGPPGIPADRLTVLRERFMAAVNDPQLRDEMRRLRAPLTPEGGDAVARKISAALNQPPEIMALLRHAATGK